MRASPGVGRRLRRNAPLTTRTATSSSATMDCGKTPTPADEVFDFGLRATLQILAAPGAGP